MTMRSIGKWLYITVVSTLVAVLYGAAFMVIVAMATKIKAAEIQCDGPYPCTSDVPAVSGEDSKAVWLLENPGKETTFYLLDSITGHMENVGTVYYNPKSDSWIIDLPTGRVGIKCKHQSSEKIGKGFTVSY